MNVIITHFKVDERGNHVYHEDKPVTIVTRVKLPLKFGYGSYNEPKKVINTGINVEDVVSIHAEGELNMTDV